MMNLSIVLSYHCPILWQTRRGKLQTLNYCVDSWSPSSSHDRNLIIVTRLNLFRIKIKISIIATTFNPFSYKRFGIVVSNFFFFFYLFIILKNKIFHIVKNVLLKKFIKNKTYFNGLCPIFVVIFIRMIVNMILVF